MVQDQEVKGSKEQQVEFMNKCSVYYSTVKTKIYFL